MIGTAAQFGPPPPHETEKPITFKKPRGGPKINPWKLKKYRKRLRKQYPWLDADVQRLGVTTGYTIDEGEEDEDEEIGEGEGEGARPA